ADRAAGQQRADDRVHVVVRSTVELDVDVLAHGALLLRGRGRATATDDLDSRVGLADVGLALGGSPLHTAGLDAHRRCGPSPRVRLPAGHEQTNHGPGHRVTPLYGALLPFVGRGGRDLESFGGSGAAPSVVDDELGQALLARWGSVVR